MSMTWVAVETKGSEWVFSGKPKRSQFNTWRTEVWDNAVKLPKGSIKKLIGRELTWSDEPVKLE